MFRLTILLITVLPSFLVAQERDPWLGKSVFVKEGAVAKVGNETVDRSKLLFPSTVGDVNGDWLWLGRAWVQKKDVMEAQEALEFYTEQIRLSPGVSSNWNGRAAVWNEKGEIENAIKDATEAIRLDPKEATAYGRRGDSLHEKGDLDAAIKDFTEAIRLDPKFSVAIVEMHLDVRATWTHLLRTITRLYVSIQRTLTPSTISHGFTQLVPMKNTVTERRLSISQPMPANSLRGRLGIMSVLLAQHMLKQATGRMPSSIRRRR